MSKLHLSSTVVSMGYDTTNRSTQYQLQLSLHHMPEDGSIRRSPLWSCLLKMAATWIFKSGSIVHQSNSCEAQIQRVSPDLHLDICAEGYTLRRTIERPPWLGTTWTGPRSKGKPCQLPKLSHEPQVIGLWKSKKCRQGFVNPNVH